jgi:hypothetical protein
MGRIFEMGKKARMEHGMRGMEVEDFLKGNTEGLQDRDMDFAVYPSNKEIENLGLRGIYIGNYIKWDAFEQTKKMITEYDWNTGIQSGTFDIYDNVETYWNGDVHAYMRYLKYGYGRAVDHASNLIRLGYITREEGAWLVNRYDGKIDRNKWEEFLKWIDMPEAEVLGYCLKYRDPRTDFEKILPECLYDPSYKLPYIENLYQGRKGRIII